MSKKLHELRQAIRRLVEEYYREAFPPGKFLPGESRVQYAGRVFEEREMANMLKPTDIQAALGVEELEKLPDFVAARKRNFAALHEKLSPYKEFFILPEAQPKSDPSWFAFPLTIRDEAPFNRRALTTWLEAHNIETRLIFSGNILRQSAYQEIPHRVGGSLQNSDKVMRQSFFVGVYPGLTPAMLAHVADTIGEFVSKAVTGGPSVPRA